METFKINDLTIYGIDVDGDFEIRMSDGSDYGISFSEFLNVEDIKELIEFLQKQLEK